MMMMMTFLLKGAKAEKIKKRDRKLREAKAEARKRGLVAVVVRCFIEVYYPRGRRPRGYE